MQRDLLGVAPSSRTPSAGSSRKHVQEQLLIEAARIEVRAVLDKVDGLKTPTAKRRNLEEALANLRNDPVPDELQAREIEMLEDALRDV